MIRLNLVFKRNLPGLKSCLTVPKTNYRRNIKDDRFIGDYVR
jgi:hypothetical protein